MPRRLRPSSPSPNHTPPGDCPQTSGSLQEAGYPRAPETHTNRTKRGWGQTPPPLSSNGTPNVPGVAHRAWKVEHGLVPRDDNQLPKPCGFEKAAPAALGSGVSERLVVCSASIVLSPLAMTGPLHCLEITISVWPLCATTNTYVAHQSTSCYVVDLGFDSGCQP
jgi:hypothetical protein